jgi:hypothetical protein
MGVVIIGAVAIYLYFKSKTEQTRYVEKAGQGVVVMPASVRLVKFAGGTINKTTEAATEEAKAVQTT